MQRQASYFSNTENAPLYWTNSRLGLIDTRGVWSGFEKKNGMNIFIYLIYKFYISY